MPGKVVVMLSVAAVRADNAWATGYAARRSGRDGRLVVEHWSGRTWRRVTVPGRAMAAFDRGTSGYAGPPFAIVGASSARNVWAFNQMTGAWLRWDGHRWSHGVLPGHAGWVATAITSELVLGGDDVWAFGARVNARAQAFPFAARFDGRGWAVTQMPRVPNLLVSAASAVNANDIWAVIGYGGQVAFPAQGNGGALARWNGQSWRLAPLPASFTRHGDPTSIKAYSDRDVWVGGGAADGGTSLTEAVARWGGSRWRAFRIPATGSKADCVLRSIVQFRAGLLGLGDCFSHLNPGDVWSRLRWLSAGRWTGPVRLRLAGQEPVFLDLAGLGRAGPVWAVGYTGGAGIIAVSGAVSPVS